MKALLLIIVGLLSSAPSVAQSSERVTRLLAEADRLHDIDRNLDALKALAEAQKLDAKLADGERIARFAGGRFDESDEKRRDQILSRIYATQLQRRPDDATSAVAYAALLRSSKRNKEASAVLESAARQPNGTKARAELAAVQWLAGKEVEAIAAMQPLLERDDTDALYYLGLRASELATQHPSKNRENQWELINVGEEAVEKMMVLEPSHLEAFVQMALLLREESKLAANAEQRSALMDRAKHYRDEATNIREARNDGRAHQLEWSIEIVQDGRSHLVSSESVIMLDRKPFLIRVRLPSELPVMLNVSKSSAAHKRVNPGFHFVNDCLASPLPPCNGTGMAEDPSELSRLVIKEEAMHYLFDTISTTRWSRVSRLDDWMIYDREVKYLDTTPIGRTDVDELYLTFVIRPRGGRRVLADELRKTVVVFQ